MMSTPSRASLTMPSVSAAAVQPVPKLQARAETSLAPGAWPFIVPPNRECAAAIPATCEPCSPEAMPMSTAVTSL